MKHNKVNQDVISNCRVAWLTPVLGVFGELMYWGPLLESFARACHDFRVFTTEYGGEHGHLPYEIERCGIVQSLYNKETYDSSEKKHGKTDGINVISSSVVNRLITYRPDLVVCNELGLFTLYGVIYAKFRVSRVPLLIIVESRPRVSNAKLLNLTRQIFRLILCRFGDAFLTNSNPGFEYLTSCLRIPGKKIIKKPYLISSFPEATQAVNEQRTASTRPSDHNKIHLLYVGRLIRGKGVHLALESIAAIEPDARNRLIFDIVGDGPYRDALEAMTRTLGLADIVRFHGKQSHHDLPNIYSSVQALVFPTLSDYRALAPFEALSVGLPILDSIYDGGNSESVIHGENGFIFDPRQPGQLTNYLSQILENPAILQRFSQKSLEMAKPYTLENATSAFVEACHLALRHKRS